MPPMVTNEMLTQALSRHGKIVTPIKKLSGGFQSPLLKHVMSFRSQVSHDFKR
uniref:Uncharacterized protein n=1 Tax=Anguilla anguilla TaxID=7936 RepID=A0A0E9UW22_ANGAN